MLKKNLSFVLILVLTLLLVVIVIFVFHKRIEKIDKRSGRDLIVGHVTSYYAENRLKNQAHSFTNQPVCVKKFYIRSPQYITQSKKH